MDLRCVSEIRAEEHRSKLVSHCRRVLFCIQTLEASCLGETIETT